MFYPASYLTQVWLGSQVSTRFLPSRARPLAAHVKLTENCQAKCISCDYWKMRWDDGLNTERAIDLVNQIGAAGIRSLRFTGGEPLLRRDFFEVLAKADTKPFEKIILQTNGLLLKKLHKEINASPISKVAVSIDGLKATNDVIRGIKGYFDLGMEGISLLRGKEVVISVTLNKISADELKGLAEAARSVGAEIETNILSRSLFFLANADLASMWPGENETEKIAEFVREDLGRPGYEVEYVRKYYRHEEMDEPECVLGFLQVFVLSNGDVLTGCYPLKPVGNVLRERLETILASEAYREQAMAMIRRECPGCTCGVESSLAMRHSVASGFFELGKLLRGKSAKGKAPVAAPKTAAAEPVSVSMAGRISEHTDVPAAVLSGGSGKATRTETTTPH
jgi:MoaA/NifB/PqqE/SkfB family radical SAM enzyme